MNVDTMLLLSLAVSAAVLVAVVASTQPADRVVGRLTVFALAVVVAFPVGFMPTAVRTGEILLFTGIASLAVILRKRARYISPTIALLLAAYFAITAAVTYTFGLTSADEQLLRHVVIGAVFFALGTRANAAEKRTITGGVIALASAQSAYAIVEFFVLPPVIWNSPVPENYPSPDTRLLNELLPGYLRAQGTFGHPLFLAFFITVALALALRFDFRNPRTRLIIIAVLAGGAFACGSRSAVVVIAALLAFAYGSRIRLVRGTVVLGTAAAFAFALSFASSEVGTAFFGGDSVGHRQGAFEALPRILERPTGAVLFGNGWYSRQWLFDRGFLQSDGLYAVDNQFVSLIVSSGLVGLGIFLALFAVAIRRTHGSVQLALLTSLALYFVIDVNEYPAPWALLALLFGLAAARPTESTNHLVTPHLAIPGYDGVRRRVGLTEGEPPSGYGSSKAQIHPVVLVPLRKARATVHGS